MKILLFFGKLLAMHTFLMFAFVSSVTAGLGPSHVVCKLSPYGDNYLSVRACGDSGCREKFRIGPGEAVDVIDRSGSWRKVETSYGVGWVYGRYLCVNDNP